MPRAGHCVEQVDPRASRWLRTVTATEVVAAVGLGALALAFVLSPDHIEDGPVLCPFRRLTGLPCPGCGLTRSWVYLAHGQWHEAMAAHPFGLVAALLVIALVAAVVIARLRRRPPPDLDDLITRPWAVILVGAWLVFAAVRLALAL